MSCIAVIDFETTGISPALGDRATEVAIVLLEAGQVVGRFQSLMNAGVQVPAFVTQLTGISNSMLAQAPAAERVMRDAARFVGDTPMVAHNAAFDRKFWQAELALADLPAPQPFVCTVLLARRLVPNAPNHRLGTLVDFLHLPRTGRAHRAMADAEMAAALLQQLRQDLCQRWQLAQADHALLRRVQACSRLALPALLAREAAACSAKVAEIER